MKRKITLPKFPKKKFVAILEYDCGCEYEAGPRECLLLFADTLEKLKERILKYSLIENCHWTYPYKIIVLSTEKDEIFMVTHDLKLKFPIYYEITCNNFDCHLRNFVSKFKLKKCPSCGNKATSKLIENKIEKYEI